MSSSELTRANLLRIQEKEKIVDAKITNTERTIEDAIKTNKDANEELRQLKEKKKSIIEKIVDVEPISDRLKISKWAKDVLRLCKMVTNNVAFLVVGKRGEYSFFIHVFSWISQSSTGLHPIPREFIPIIELVGDEEMKALGKAVKMGISLREMKGKVFVDKIPFEYSDIILPEVTKGFSDFVCDCYYFKPSSN